jgi:hypothetical protein
VLTQTLPLVWAPAISELVAAGPDAVFEEVFFVEVLAGAAAAGDAVLADGAGALIGFAAGAEALAGVMALSFAADFLLLLFALLVAVPGALAAAGAFEDPAVAGAEASAVAVFLPFFLPLFADVEDVALEAGAGTIASVDFLFFFLLVPVLLVLVEAEDLSVDAVVSSALGDFLLLLFFDFVDVLLSAVAPVCSLDASVAVFFLLFFLLVVVDVVDVEKDWSVLELLCACTSGANPRNTNNAVATKSVLARGRFISSLL